MENPENEQNARAEAKECIQETFRNEAKVWGCPIAGSMVESYTEEVNEIDVQCVEGHRPLLHPDVFSCGSYNPAGCDAKDFSESLDHWRTAYLLYRWRAICQPSYLPSSEDVANLCSIYQPDDPTCHIEIQVSHYG